MKKRAALVAALLLAAVGAAAQMSGFVTTPGGSDGQLQYNNAYVFGGVSGSSVKGSTVQVAQIEASTAAFGSVAKSTFDYTGALLMGADVDLKGNAIKNGSGAYLTGIPSSGAVSAVDSASLARDVLLGAATHTLDLARIALETSSGTLQAETAQLRLDTGTLETADLAEAAAREALATAVQADTAAVYAILTSLGVSSAAAHDWLTALGASSATFRTEMTAVGLSTKTIYDALNSTGSALTNEIARAQAAEALKYDKTGGAISGPAWVSGDLSATSVTADSVTIKTDDFSIAIDTFACGNGSCAMGMSPSKSQGALISSRTFRSGRSYSSVIGIQGIPLNGASIGPDFYVQGETYDPTNNGTSFQMFSHSGGTGEVSTVRQGVSSGTILAPLGTKDGQCADWEFSGHDTSDWVGLQAGMQTCASEDWNGTSRGSKIKFKTTPKTTTTAQQNLYLDSNATGTVCAGDEDYCTEGQHAESLVTSGDASKKNIAIRIDNHDSGGHYWSMGEELYQADTTAGIFMFTDEYSRQYVGSSNYIRWTINADGMMTIGKTMPNVRGGARLTVQNSTGPAQYVMAISSQNGTTQAGFLGNGNIVAQDFDIAGSSSVKTLLNTLNTSTNTLQSTKFPYTGGAVAGHVTIQSSSLTVQGNFQSVLGTSTDSWKPGTCVTVTTSSISDSRWAVRIATVNTGSGDTVVATIMVPANTLNALGQGFYVNAVGCTVGLINANTSIGLNGTQLGNTGTVGLDGCWAYEAKVKYYQPKAQHYMTKYFSSGGASKIGTGAYAWNESHADETEPMYIDLILDGNSTGDNFFNYFEVCY